MSAIIKKASSQDAERILWVRNHCRGQMTRDTREIGLDEQRAWFAGLDPARIELFAVFAPADTGYGIVGFGLVRLAEIGGGEHWTVSGGLLETVRGQGIGTKLFQRLTNEARSRAGEAPIFLEVRADNAAARRVYNHLGYRYVRETDGVVLMRLDHPAVAARQALRGRGGIRRVLLAVIDYDHPQRGMEHAFEGIFGRDPDHVNSFNYLDLERRGRSRAAIEEAFVEKVSVGRPDWVFMQLQETGVISADAIRRARTAAPQAVFTHWTGDCREAVSPYLASICQATHMTLASSVGQLDLFRAAGAPQAEYMQIGVDWHEDLYGEPACDPGFRVPDVVFCGGYYPHSFPAGTSEREAVVRALIAAELDVGVVGGGWPADCRPVGKCGVKQQFHVWSRAKVGISVNHFNQIARYYSDRQLIAMASGTPIVCKRVPGLEFEFQDGHDCLMFDQPDEAVALVKALLASESDRARIGAAGRARVFRDHTWFQRILWVLPEIERIRGSLL